MAVDELASEPRRLLRCSLPMPGRESRDRKGQSPKTLVMRSEDKHLPAGRTTGRNLSPKARAPLPDAFATMQASRCTSSCAPGTGDPERVPRNRSVDD